MTKRVSHERFTQTAVRILQAMTRASEMGLDSAERPTEEQLLEFIHEANRVHIAEIECVHELNQIEKEHERAKDELDRARGETQRLQDGLNTAVKEADELRKKLAGLPTWFADKMFAELTPDDIHMLSASKQWVLLVSPHTDWMNWFTVAQTLLRFKVVGIPTRNGWSILAGTWNPDTRDPRP